MNLPQKHPRLGLRLHIRHTEEQGQNSLDSLRPTVLKRIGVCIELDFVMNQDIIPSVIKRY